MKFGMYIYYTNYWGQANNLNGMTMNVYIGTMCFDDWAMEFYWHRTMRFNNGLWCYIVCRWFQSNLWHICYFICANLGAFLGLHLSPHQEHNKTCKWCICGKSSYKGWTEGGVVATPPPWHPHAHLDFYPSPLLSAALICWTGPHIKILDPPLEVMEP